MANWQDLVSPVLYSGSNSGSGIKVGIQYDKDSITTTEVKCRTKAWLTKWNTTTDTFFIYSKDGDISRICYLNGSSTSQSSPYHSNTFILTKDKEDTYFTMPEVKICNDGHHHDKSAYTDSNGRGASMYWGSGRGDWATMMNKDGTTLNTTVYVTAVTGGSVVITDNYNNKFSITATAAAATAHNPVSGLTGLKYGYSASSRTTSYTNGTLNNLSLSGTSNTRTVYAEATTNATYLTDPKATGSLAIRQYKAPKAPGTPTLANSSYKNGRLTIKQPWTWNWTAAAPGTGSGTTIGTGTGETTSKVTGYRIKIYKKRPPATTFSEIDFTDADGNTSSGKILDVATNSFSLDPVASGFLANDQVRIGVKPYTQYGEQCDGDKLFSSDYTYSAGSTVQNAGVMRVKANVGTASKPVYDWREGVVWVKVNKGTAANPVIDWVEADIVKAKVNTGTADKPVYEWKEST